MPARCSSYQLIYDVVQRIPVGRVATYGQVAEAAGLIGQARQVGYALHAMPDDPTIPWHRVVNAQGRIRTGDGAGRSEQQQRLEAEGVRFVEPGRLRLRDHQWSGEAELAQSTPIAKRSAASGDGRAMNTTEVMSALEAAGSEACRSTYARHGVKPPMFGVRYGDLGKLVRKIKVDHLLALELWETGNHDARIMATMIADPDRFAVSTLDSWAKVIDNELMLDAVCSLVGRSKHARSRMVKWMKAKPDWLRACGWRVVAVLAGTGGRTAKLEVESLTDEECAALLVQIERMIHEQPNRTRHEMNNALISIGVRGGKLEKAALAAAKRIGTVDVDHGDTACKTPDAASYIRKTLDHRKRKSKETTKKSPTKKSRTRAKG
jgi:alkylated DNA nucleotide flippase Atl1/3-methyladenine DNA glycosylase AlkD